MTARLTRAAANAPRATTPATCPRRIGRARGACSRASGSRTARLRGAGSAATGSSPRCAPNGPTRSRTDSREPRGGAGRGAAAAHPNTTGLVASMATIHGSRAGSRYFQVNPMRQFSHSSPCSSSGRNGPNQVVGSSRCMRAGAPSHLRSRARAISSGSSTRRLIRYPSRLKNRISSR